MRMNLKMKINVYPISSSLHDKTNLDLLSTTLLDELSHLGVTTNIVDDINKLYANCDLSFIFVLSGGSENTFKALLPKLKEPFYLLSYATNNSLAASLEILSYLKNQNLKGEILHGDTSYIAQRIKQLNDLKDEEKNEVTLGLLGEPSDWLISSDVDENVLYNRLHIKIKHIPLKELVETYHTIKVEKSIEPFKKAKDEIEGTKAYKLYLALDQLVNKYHLQGFSVRCFDLLNELQTTACLALSKFNDRGIIATCEGDVPSLIAMYIASKLNLGPSFQANPSKLDVLDNKILLAHCTIPLRLCSSYLLDTHFESNIGLAIHGEVIKGKATMFRLDSKLERCFISEGKIIANQYEKNLCRTQIVCEFENLDKLLKEPLGNHEIIVLGHHKQKLLQYLNSMGFKII